MKPYNFRVLTTTRRNLEARARRALRPRGLTIRKRGSGYVIVKAGTREVVAGEFKQTGSWDGLSFDEVFKFAKGESP